MATHEAFADSCGSTQAPILFICKGLGGLIALGVSRPEFSVSPHRDASPGSLLWEFMEKALTGSLLLFQALHELEQKQKSQSSRPLPTPFMRFAFFGTPLNHQQRKAFTTAIRYCDHLERGRHDDNNKQYEVLSGREKCVTWIRQLEDTARPRPCVMVCETKTTKLSDDKWFSGGKAKLVSRLQVPRQVVVHQVL